MNELEMTLTRQSFVAWYKDGFSPYAVRMDVLNKVIVRGCENEILEQVCPSWIKFLSTSFSKPSHARGLQEWFGYLMIADVSLDRMLVLVGPPASGKTVVNTVLHAVLGVDRVVESSFDALARRHFELSKYVDELAVVLPIDHEVPPACRKSLCVLLKQLTGGGNVVIDRKYQPQLADKIDARLVVTANEMPSILSESPAMMRRVCWIPMVRAAGVDIDPELSSRVIDEDDGIALWGLLGLLRLIWRVESSMQTMSFGGDEVFLDTFLPDELAEMVTETCS